MNRTSLFFAIIAVSFFMLSVTAHAYTDTMQNVQQDEIRACYNLKALETGSAPWDGKLLHNSILTFANTSQTAGRVVYTVRQAESITVGIYTHTGAFISKAANDVYALGFYSTSGDLTVRPPGSEMAKLSYSPSRQTLYRNDANPQSLVGNYYYEFRDTSESLPPDLIDYAINVYESADGQSYQKVNLTPGRVIYLPGVQYCYEEFTGYLSASAASVVVEINDFNQYYDAFTQKLTPKLQRYMTALAHVSFAGSNLALGPVRNVLPEQSYSSAPPPSSSSPPSDSSVSSSKSSQQSTSSSSPKTASSSKSSSGAKASSSSKSSSSKFEGVIASGISSSSSKKESQPSQSSKSRAAEKSEPVKSNLESIALSSSVALPETSYAELPSQASVITYEVKGESDKPDGFTVGVIVYIGIVCLFILFIILRPSKK